MEWVARSLNLASSARKYTWVWTAIAFKNALCQLIGSKRFEFHSLVDKAFEVSSSLHPHSNPYGLGIKQD